MSIVHLQNLITLQPRGLKVRLDGLELTALKNGHRILEFCVYCQPLDNASKYSQYRMIRMMLVSQ
jgi:hypothetical protein